MPFEFLAAEPVVNVPDEFTNTLTGGSSLTPPEDGPMPTVYAMTTHYERDYGKLAFPVADGDEEGACVIIRKHRGIGYKMVRWVAQRIGVKPILPSSYTGTDNEVLMRDAISMAMPGNLADGSQIFSIAGVYLYVLRRKPSAEDPLPMGVSPIDKNKSITDNLLLPADFADWLLGPVPPLALDMALKLPTFKQ